jgi:hypothetical protein
VDTVCRCNSSIFRQRGKELEDEFFEIFYQLWKSGESSIVPEEWTRVVNKILENHLLSKDYSIPVSDLDEIEKLAAIANQRAIEKVKAEDYEELNRPK